jgi:hypothetical protein
MDAISPWPFKKNGEEDLHFTKKITLNIFFEIDVVHVWKATKTKIDLLKGAI